MTNTTNTRGFFKRGEKFLTVEGFKTLEEIKEKNISLKLINDLNIDSVLDELLKKYKNLNNLEFVRI